MAKQYQVTNTMRFFNRMMVRLMRWGVPFPKYSLLTVRGRKSGEPFSLPVIVVEKGGKRWLVSPYGEVNWVKNARVAGEVKLLRRGKEETVRL
jgi:hypothetical protein